MKKSRYFLGTVLGQEDKPRSAESKEQKIEGLMKDSRFFYQYINNSIHVSSLQFFRKTDNPICFSEIHGLVKLEAAVIVNLTITGKFFAAFLSCPCLTFVQ